MKKFFIKGCSFAFTVIEIKLLFVLTWT